ncbi:fungal-specific transcription factor domain-containing protein [Mycena capillaripes]|nr:fungal-specific transcription factor domain-containing protein [Mycena capillaripes]
MSSQAPTESRAAPKRRRLRGACDHCRGKKIRCEFSQLKSILSIIFSVGDSSEMPGNKCSNCIFFKTQCTHLYISKESHSLNYKNSREHVAAILSQTTVYVPSDDPTVLFQFLVNIAKYARNLEELLAVSSTTSLDLESSPFADPEDNNSIESLEADSPAEADDLDDGVFVNSTIVEPMSRLALRAPARETHERYLFFGKSSSVNFMKAAMEDVDHLGETFDAQRPEFWIVKNWHPDPPPLPPYTFPDEDLLQSLIDIYFQKINPISFLLHSPTFCASVADGEYLRDQHFGAVVLAVCALASRLSDDPRVLIAADTPLHSAGWKWFSQIRPLQLVALPPTSGSRLRTLYNLQLICLSVLFLATSSARACWIFSALGIRIAQESGAHRRGRYSTGSRAEGEMLKRTFWVLIAQDTILSSLFGRSTISTSEDYDVDLPTECDDEYWDDPHSFQQPANKPALTAYMTSYLQLMVIFSRAHRAIYSVKRRKECEPAVVAELDSALNKWVDSIPSHLRWPANPEGIFLDQSASLYLTYYQIQILIHRPFIPAPGETYVAESAFPSLAICANSARSCGHVMELHSRRSGDILHYPYAITAMFDSAVILLLNVWGGRRATSSSDIIRARADIKKCVDVLHLYEKQYPVAGRQCDVITEMLNRASGNTPQGNSRRMLLKRPMPEDAEDDHAPLPTATAARQLEQLELSIQQTDHLFSLPLYTQELGLLPVYESFDFQLTFNPLQTPPPHLSSEFGFSSLDEAYAINPEQTGYVPNSDEQFVVPAAPYSWQDWSDYTGPERSC